MKEKMLYKLHNKEEDKSRWPTFGIQLTL